MSVEDTWKFSLLARRPLSRRISLPPHSASTRDEMAPHPIYLDLICIRSKGLFYYDLKVRYLHRTHLATSCPGDERGGAHSTGSLLTPALKTQRLLCRETWALKVRLLVFESTQSSPFELQRPQRVDQLRLLSIGADRDFNESQTIDPI